MGSSPGAAASVRKLSQPKKKPAFERRIIRLIGLLAAPGLVVTGILVYRASWPLEFKLALVGGEALLALILGATLHEHLIRPLQTLANVVGALRDEDYSFRARWTAPDDALGELSREVNALADLLAQHRTGVIEATALLERIVQEVDIPILAFDAQSELRLVNSAGEKLLERSSQDLLGKTAAELHLEAALSAESNSVLSLPFVAGARWFLRRSSFRQGGIPHTLVVLSDVSRALQDEERRAWQRLIRVIGHELNNSLAPIKSIAGSLNARLPEVELPSDDRQDFERGLAIIAARAASLNRFLQAYRQLAQMPRPALRKCAIPELIKRVAALETRLEVSVRPGPDVTIMADADQLEQMLINLVRNAADAALEVAPHNSNSGESGDGRRDSKPKVEVGWRLNGKDLVLSIEDNGPGLLNPANAFVPFYTTKPQGSGIGLVLSRQIAEAHGGSLELSSQAEGRGCTVEVTLPRINTGEHKPRSA
jgi:nitrogen fixation/metabolism regulation signal transduction histidine kinase